MYSEFDGNTFWCLERVKRQLAYKIELYNTRTSAIIADTNKKSQNIWIFFSLLSASVFHKKIIMHEIMITFKFFDLDHVCASLTLYSMNSFFRRFSGHILR